VEARRDGVPRAFGHRRVRCGLEEVPAAARSPTRSRATTAR
jgi:hypothetical protein